MTDKTQTKAVSNAPLTDGEFAEKYNKIGRASCRERV